MLTPFLKEDSLQCFIFPDMPFWWMYHVEQNKWWWLPHRTNEWQEWQLGFDKCVPDCIYGFAPSLDKAIIRMVNRIQKKAPE